MDISPALGKETDRPLDQTKEDITRKRPHLMVDPTSPESPVTVGVLRGLLNDTLDAKLQTVFERLDSIEHSLQNNNEELKTVPSLKQDLDDTKTELKKTKDELYSLRMDFNQMREQTVKAEAYSRRDNLKFFGVSDAGGETWAHSEKAVKEVIQSMGIQDASSIPVVRCHRIGRFNGVTLRPIIIRFQSFDDRQRVWNARRQLKGTNIYVAEDFPKVIDDRRKVLYPVFKAARTYRPPDAPNQNLKVSLRLDRLVLNGTSYSVDDLHKLPECLQPEFLATKETESMIGFYGKPSPFSNHHPAMFEIDGISFTCMEQYMAYQKAIMFDDKETSQQILATQDLSEIGYLRKHVHRYNVHVWHEEAPDIIKRGLIAKFSQNKMLKDKLLATGTKIFVEASPYDSFWGVGLGLRDSRLENHAEWKGENKLGILLGEIREQLHGE